WSTSRRARNTTRANPKPLRGTPAHLRSSKLPIFLGDPLAGRIDELFAIATINPLEHVVQLLSPFEHTSDEVGKPLAHVRRQHAFDKRERDRAHAFRRDLVRSSEGLARPRWPALLEIRKGSLAELAIIWALWLGVRSQICPDASGEPARRVAGGAHDGRAERLRKQARKAAVGGRESPRLLITPPAA